MWYTNLLCPHWYQIHSIIHPHTIWSDIQTFRHKAKWKQLLEHQKQGGMSTSRTWRWKMRQNTNRREMLWDDSDQEVNMWSDNCKTADPWTTVTFLQTSSHVTMRQKANGKTDEQVNYTWWIIHFYHNCRLYSLQTRLHPITLGQGPTFLYSSHTLYS